MVIIEIPFEFVIVIVITIAIGFFWSFMSLIYQNTTTYYDCSTSRNISNVIRVLRVSTVCRCYILTCCMCVLYVLCLQGMRHISKNRQSKMIEADIAFEEQINANDTLVKSVKNVQTKSVAIEIPNSHVLEKEIRISSIHRISTEEVPVSMTNVFPRNACANFSRITRLRTFTKEKLCTVFTARQELSQQCHATMQGEIHRALAHVSREWRRLPPLCTRYRAHYKKRDKFEVGRWVLESMEAKKTHQTETLLTPHDVLRLLSKKTIVFFGDSWLREIFVSMLALLTGEEMDDTNRTFPQGDNRQHWLSQNRLKPPRKHCLGSGLNKQGLNISHCGWTQLKIWHSNDGFDVTMIFNFRSFYKMSREFDDISFGRLQNGSGNLQPLAAGYLSPWPPADLLIITEGVWGPHGVGSGLEQMKTLYYRAVSFHGPIIWVTTDGNTANREQCKEFYQWIRKQHTSDRVFLFDRVFDLKRATELQIPNGHGYRGDIVYSHARLLFQILVSIW